MKTLPDLLRPGLAIALIGINPSLPAAAAGHYFASPRSRFWRALNASNLVSEPLRPGDDRKLLAQGIGFTDVVKRPTRAASELRAADFKRDAPLLLNKITRLQPRIVCFQGSTAYRNFLRYSGVCDPPPENPPPENPTLENPPPEKLRLGVQPRPVAASIAYLAPNPSPANAAYSLDDLIASYNRLAALRDSLAPQPSDGPPPQPSDAPPQPSESRAP